MKKGSLDLVKVPARTENISLSEDAAERVLITPSKNTSNRIEIENFDYGVDKLHLAGKASSGYELNWIAGDNDGSLNDLEITFGDRTVVLKDLEQPEVYRYEQGFENDTDGWFDSDSGWYGGVSRVSTGTEGIDSASGEFHAVFTGDDDGAPFTRYNGYEDEWSGGWTTSMKIYLDVHDENGGWAAGEGFDLSSAANGSDGNHQQDFIFHVTQDTSTGDLLIGASNNTGFAPREDLETLANHAVVDEDGWYTFEHRFYDDGGLLAVDLVVLDDNNNIIFSETRTAPENTTGDLGAIGGNRYGWFTTIEVEGGIAVDDVTLEYEAEQAPPLLPDPTELFYV